MIWRAQTNETGRIQLRRDLDEARIDTARLLAEYRMSPMRRLEPNKQPAGMVAEDESIREAVAKLESLFAQVVRQDDMLSS